MDEKVKFISAPSIWIGALVGASSLWWGWSIDLHACAMCWTFLSFWAMWCTLWMRFFIRARNCPTPICVHLRLSWGWDAPKLPHKRGFQHKPPCLTWTLIQSSTHQQLRYMKIKNVPWGSQKMNSQCTLLTPHGPNKMWYQMKSMYIQQNVGPNEI
jgi:hypothetical protein